MKYRIRQLVAFWVLSFCLPLCWPPRAQAGTFYTGSHCCNATMTGYNTATCTPGGSNTTATTISCIINISSAHHVLAVINSVGNALSTGNIISDSAGSTSGPGNIGTEAIGGIAGHFGLQLLETGTFTGLDTVTLTSGPTPDYMYILVLDFNPNQTASFDSTGVIINTGSNTATTDTTGAYLTHGTGELVIGIHGWSGSPNSGTTFTPGAGETLDYQNSTFFTLNAFPISKGFVIQESYKPASGSYTSSTTASSSSAAWTNAAVAFTVTPVETRNHSGVL